MMVEFGGPPSWSLDASETGGKYKVPVGRWRQGGGVILDSPQFHSHHETKMAVRRTQRSTSVISRKNRGL